MWGFICPVMFSGDLAERVGVNAAIFLQQLYDITPMCDGRNRPAPVIKDGLKWYEVKGSEFKRWLPFFSTEDIRKVIGELKERKILFVDTSDIEKMSDEHFEHNVSNYRIDMKTLNSL